jgi:colanic acid biosynthesis protein WcaH
MLVGRRTNQPAKGFLFVPGGRIRKNESLAGAFSRLAADELGLRSDIEQATFAGVFEHFYDTDAFEQRGSGTHYVVLAYALSVSKFRLADNEQHSEFLWLSDDEVRNNERVHENTRAYAGIGTR